MAPQMELEQPEKKAVSQLAFTVAKKGFTQSEQQAFAVMNAAVKTFDKAILG